LASASRLLKMIKFSRCTKSSTASSFQGVARSVWVPAIAGIGCLISAYALAIDVRDTSGTSNA
jgi:ABC-type spermidine/putrescine transport system permease subunit I